MPSSHLDFQLLVPYNLTVTLSDTRLFWVMEHAESESPAPKRPRSATPASRSPGRLRPVRLGQTALIVIDCQEVCWDKATDYLRERLNKTLLPNMQILLQASRAAALEIIYVVIEAMTNDCRDFAPCYKLSNLQIPKGSPKAHVLPEIAPQDDDIVIRKGSLSAFCSTNIDFVLRNLGVKDLLMVGMRTNQCVEGAVRDASDLGYMVTVVDECCGACSETEHTNSLDGMRTFARVMTTSEVCEELEHLLQAKKRAT